MRIRFILFFFTLLFFACNDKQQEDPKRPNIIMILADDQGWGDLSRNGNEAINTPNIDKLANNGISMENFYVCAVCSPTRAEMLTGRYAVRGGVYSTSRGGERLDLDEQTIAEVFKQNGYKTGAFGKWHNGQQYPYHPNGRGFDEFYGYCSGHWGNYFSPMLDHNGKIVKGEGYLTNDLTNKAMQFMQANKDSAFFLYLPLNTPHSPMQVPDTLWERFKDKKLPNHRYSDKEKPNKTRAALAMVENIDQNVGRVMQKLQELKLEENTIVIYFSDNGPNGFRYNGNMKGVKGKVDEGGVKTPFFIQWKGVLEAGREITTIASGMDILPTLAELAELNFQPKKALDGKSLKALLLDEKEMESRFIANHWKGKISIRSQKFRLDENDQLFDMENDPQQRTNVAENFPKEWQRMKDFKTKWKNEVLSELPEEDTRTFTIGHPDWEYNQLPVRDADAHGNVKRSNRWPNSSYFTNWTSTTDSITWNVNVMKSGNFEAIVYYTCSEENVGSTIELSLGKNKISGRIDEAHNPPLIGANKDRFPREESYVKDFRPMRLGKIRLEKGAGFLTLKALTVKGEQVADVRWVVLRQVN